MKITMPKKVNYIINELISHGYDAYAVGGCVRDSILGRVPQDWDITTSANPYDVKKIFSHTIDTGIKHGTVTILLEKEGFEVTTYRVDGEYEDNRHPKQVEFTSSLAEDLMRRDFTINAMAYNETKGLVDIFGGVMDIEEKRIRCVGSAIERFDEDALRILRAVRFSAQLGFSIDEETLQAIKDRAKNLKNISAERIRVELSKLLVSPYPERLLVAYDAGITAVILPEFDAMMRTKQPNSHHLYNVGLHTINSLFFLQERYSKHLLEYEECYEKKKEVILRLTMLFHDVAKPNIPVTFAEREGYFKDHAKKGAKVTEGILRRLKFDNETIALVCQLINYHDFRYGQTIADMRRACNLIGIEVLPLLFEVQYVDLLAQNPEYTRDSFLQLQKARETYAEIVRTSQCVNLKMLAVNGKDLIQAGFEPGILLGEILNNLLDLVLEDPTKNDKEVLITIAKQTYTIKGK